MIEVRTDDGRLLGWLDVKDQGGDRQLLVLPRLARTARGQEATVTEVYTLVFDLFRRQPYEPSYRAIRSGAISLESWRRLRQFRPDLPACAEDAAPRNTC